MTGNKQDKKKTTPTKNPFYHYQHEQLPTPEISPLPPMEISTPSQALTLLLVCKTKRKRRICHTAFPLRVTTWSRIILSLVVLVIAISSSTSSSSSSTATGASASAGTGAANSVGSRASSTSNRPPLFVIVQSSSSSSSSPPPPPPPPASDNNNYNNNNNDDYDSNYNALRVTETEVWSASTQTWIGPTSGSRWTHYPSQNPCASPAQLEAPPNCYFDGDWKIVLGAGRDAYGWEYIGKIFTTNNSHTTAQQQQTIQRRQRIWLRAVVKNPPPTAATAATTEQESTSETQHKPKEVEEERRVSKPKRRRRSTATKGTRSKLTSSSSLKFFNKHPSSTRLFSMWKQQLLLQPQLQQFSSMTQSAWKNVKDDWNFKGFGFSFYKSLIFKSSVGASFRIPLSVNWDVFERHPEWPRFTSSISFYHSMPWNPTIGFFLSCSVNVEWCKYVFMQWLIIIRHAIAVSMLILARGFLVAGSALAYPVTRQLLHQTQDEWPIWDSLPSLRQSLREQPRLFSTTLQERVGVSWGWRISRIRGYEYRQSIWHLYLPTLLSLLEYLDMFCAQCIRFLPKSQDDEETSLFYANPVLRRWRDQLSNKPLDDDTATANSSSSSSKMKNKDRKVLSLVEQAQESKWADWLVQRKTGSLGISTGYPIPDKPHFSFSAVLSLSGFYFLQQAFQSQRGASIIADATGSSTGSSSEGEISLPKSPTLNEARKELDVAAFASTAMRKASIAVDESNESTAAKKITTATVTANA